MRPKRSIQLSTLTSLLVLIVSAFVGIGGLSPSQRLHADDSLTPTPTLALTPIASRIDTTKLGTLTPGAASRVTRLADFGRGRIEKLAWSSNNTVLAVAGSRGIWLYDPAHWDKEPTLLQDSEPIDYVSISPNGKWMAAEGRGEVIYLWDLPSRKLQARLETRSIAPVGLAFDATATTLVSSSSDGKLTIWDMASPQAKLVRVIDACRYIFALAFSPTEPLLAVACDTLQLWDTRTWQLKGVFETSDRYVVSHRLAFSPDGMLLVSEGNLKWEGEFQPGVTLWNVQTLKLDTKFTTTEKSTIAIAVSPDGKLVAAGSEDNTVKVWSLRDKKIYADLGAHPSEIADLTFSPNNQFLVVGIRHEGLFIWDMTTSQQAQRLLDFTPGVTSLIELERGILAGYVSRLTDGNRLWFWDIAFPDRKATLSYSPSRSLDSMSFSPDGLVAVLDRDTSLRVWNLLNSELQKRWTMYLDVQDSGPIQFNNTGSLLAFGSLNEGVVRVYSLIEGANTREFGADGVGVVSLAFRFDSLILASGGNDGNIHLWSIDPRGENTMLEGHLGSVASLAFSPDGTLLASGGYDNTVRLWDVEAGQQKQILERHKSFVYALAFSPDGSLLASGDYDGVIHLWEVKTGKLVAVLKGHTSSVKSLIFSKDGKLLISGGDDGAVILWGAKPG